MSVTRRLRYEILRRDNFTCHYCGHSSPDVKLTVDHVIPVALGGSDEAGNLVAACQACNAGKSSTPADAPLVADVDRRAIEWASAMERAAAIQAGNRDMQTAYVERFDEAWESWTYPDGGGISRADDWRTTVKRWHDLGLEIDVLVGLINDVVPRNIPDSRMWRYFCGAAWGVLRERQDIARDLVEVDTWENPF